ncbi:MAG TPA: hypothetical protein VGB54_07625 [Allosphingosinicella sp.]|jgi:hypothetical protein
MDKDKSGAGYGDQGGNPASGGQDGAKSGDYEQGKNEEGISPESGSNDAKKFGTDAGQSGPEKD